MTLESGLKRRTFLLGLAGAIAAPAIVRAESIMKIAALRESIFGDYEEGTWTPILIFEAPGYLNVVHSVIVTSAFTRPVASGRYSILPSPRKSATLTAPVPALD